MNSERTASPWSVRRTIGVAVCTGAAVLAIGGVIPAMAQQKAATETANVGTASYTIEAADEAYITPYDNAEARDAQAGLDYMQTNCTLCHSVPTPSAIAPMDKQTAGEFLAHHMIESDEQSVNDMLAYFYPSQE